MDINNKTTYNRCICEWCTKKDMCDKDRFIVNNVYDKISMRCASYEYNRIPEKII